MTITRENTEAHTAHWRRVLGKDSTPAAGERKLTQAERYAAWSASVRDAERKAPVQTVRSSATFATRDLQPVQTRGTAFTGYQVGDCRHAMDGTLWRRTA